MKNQIQQIADAAAGIESYIKVSQQYKQEIDVQHILEMVADIRESVKVLQDTRQATQKALQSILDGII